MGLLPRPPAALAGLSASVSCMAAPSLPVGLGACRPLAWTILPILLSVFQAAAQNLPPLGASQALQGHSTLHISTLHCHCLQGPAQQIHYLCNLITQEPLLKRCCEMIK